MAEKTDLFVEGYYFGSHSDAEQAKLEQKKASYFETKLEGKDAQNMLAVYDKILDEKIFATPVGWEYLKKLQEELRLLGVPEETIRPIPMYVTFAHNMDGESILKQRVKTAKKRDKSKDGIRISVFVNIILVLLVAAMFLIALNSDNPNVLNYRKAITNEYASWEQELTNREKAVREKEAELGIFTD